MLGLTAFTDFVTQVGPLSEIYLSGGEPFEHPDLLNFISVARRSASRVVAYSSGTCSHNEALVPLSCEQIAAAACAGLGRIDVSLYGTSAEQHDRITQTRGSFVVTLETMRRLRMLGVAFGVHYVPLAERGDGVLSVLGLAHALGASRFHVLALSLQGRARSIVESSPSDDFYDNIRQLWSSGPSGLKIVLSSRTRRDAGITERTQRDASRAAMLDSSGFLYPGEGQRHPSSRSRRSLTSGARVDEILSELGAG